MLVLLDCRPLQHIGSDSEKSRLVFSVAAALARDKGVKWLLLADQSSPQGLSSDISDLPVLTRRAFSGAAGWKLWYDWVIPGIVRKFKPDAVMVTGGVTARSQVPQWLWMPVGVDPRQRNEVRQKLPLYARRLTPGLQRAERIFCFSEKDREWLAGTGGASPEKLLVVHPASSSAQAPLDAGERQNLKDRFAEGREYFFVDAAWTSEEEVVRLLKAFSLFKKRQLSNLRLVLSGRLTPGIREKLETYRYKEDVHFFDSPAEDERLTAAAYAALLPFEGDSLGTGLLQAWRTGVPALIRKDGRLREMADDAALEVVDADPASLAAQMMAVYKDESLRASLIERGFSRLMAFDPGRQLTEVWSLISRKTVVKL